MYKILLTCPPMIKQFKDYENIIKSYNTEIFIPNFTQTLSENELCEMLPQYDGWIIGDDPATYKVFKAGLNGKLKAVVKWGVGIDNIDLEAIKELKIPFTNIPGVFGEEVSDVAIGYLLCLTRQLHQIHFNNILNNQWFKPCGISLSNKKVCLLGFGDIGRATARKLLSFNLNVFVSDPGFSKINNEIICNYNKNIIIDNNLNKIELDTLDNCLIDADFIICTCPLIPETYHIINKKNILKAKRGVIIINVARGPVVCETDVVELLDEGYIKSVGFDVFEEEPFNVLNPLIKFKQNIYGSHNGSNTKEAVDKVSKIAIEKIYEFLTK
jgi:D-3-phosphoglycerate dehydrogenase